MRRICPTDLTVHIVGVLGSDNRNVAFVQGVAIGFGPLPRPFVQYLEQRNVCQWKFAFDFFQMPLKRKWLKSR